MTTKVKVSFDIQQAVLDQLHKHLVHNGANKAEFFRMAVLVALNDKDLKKKYFKLLTR
jgi:hypothetical protein